MTEDYIGGTVTTIAAFGHGTQLIDPADIDPMKPCVVRRLDEDYWRGILSGHFPRWLTDDNWAHVIYCKCGDKVPIGTIHHTVSANEANWVEHVLKAAAVTPEQIEGDPIPDGVPSTLLVQE